MSGMPNVLTLFTYLNTFFQAKSGTVMPPRWVMPTYFLHLVAWKLTVPPRGCNVLFLFPPLVTMKIMNLNNWISCMKAHEGVVPSIYDAPFCQDLQIEYVTCRKSLKKKENISG